MPRKYQSKVGARKYGSCDPSQLQQALDKIAAGESQHSVCNQLGITRNTLNNKELENIDNWLIENKLSLNVKKTKYILFSSRTTKILSKESVLTIRKNQIERVTSVRLLGVIFNERLTWKDQMAMLISKLKSSLYAVMRVKPFLTQEALLTLFHSLILSHIRYCITTWCYGHSVLLINYKKSATSLLI